jgi:hypothetical protein
MKIEKELLSEASQCNSSSLFLSSGPQEQFLFFVPLGGPLKAILLHFSFEQLHCLHWGILLRLFFGGAPKTICNPSSFPFRFYQKTSLRFSLE